MADLAPETVRDLRRDLKRAFDILDKRRPDYELGRDFYTGDRVEVAASKYVRKIIADNAEAMPMSFAHIPVDVIANMLELTSLGAEDREAAKIVAEVAESNDVDTLSEDWITKAGYFGDYYVIVDPTEEDDAEAILAGGIRWIGSSPLTTVIVYDPADERTELYGVKVWLDGKTWRARLYYEDCTVRMVAEKGAARDHKSFDLEYDPLEEDPEDAFVYHPGGRLLVRHLAIGGAPYGVPLHRKAWGPQDAITKISATNLANIEAIGLPARWALLDPLAEIDDDIDDDFGTDGPTTTPGSAGADGMTTASKGSKVRSVPGGIAFLRGIKEVGTFEQGDGNIFLENLDWYVRAMAVGTGIPLFEFDLKGDQPSGESRRRAMSRALKKAKRVQSAAAGFLEGIGETTLALLGRDARVTATFYPLETSTDKEGLELVALKVRNGVPVRVALLEAGYTDEQVDSWWPEDEPAVTMDMLTTLGSALAQLGTAKTLGVITDEELRAMLPTILTAARGEGPVVDEPEPEPDPLPGVVTDPSAQLKAKADALSTLIRSGADPEQAARLAGLDGLTFPNVPVVIRIPEQEAAGLEGSTAPAAPAAPAAPDEPTPPAPAE